MSVVMFRGCFHNISLDGSYNLLAEEIFNSQSAKMNCLTISTSIFTGSVGICKVSSA